MGHPLIGVGIVIPSCSQWLNTLVCEWTCEEEIEISWGTLFRRPRIAQLRAGQHLASAISV